ncbi:hypothetical protein BJX96DRAFT_177609 [Aspergillus floccosus]
MILPEKTADGLLAEAWDTNPVAVPTKSLSTILSRAAAQNPQNIAVLSLHQSNGAVKDSVFSQTFSELELRSRCLARCLLINGAAPGRSVVTFLYNQAETALLFWATAHLGCCLVPLDPKSLNRMEEAVHYLNLAEPSVIVTADSDLAEQVDRSLGQEGISKAPWKASCRLHVSGTKAPARQGWSLLPEVDASSSPSFGPLPGADLGLNDPVVLFFTSGTTSLPKACPLSTTNIVTPAMCLVASIGAEKGDAVIQHLPNFHSYGLAVSIGIWLRGGTVLFPSARFDPSKSVQAMEYAVSRSWMMHLPCVPSMLQAVAAHPECPPRIPLLRSIIIGGAPVLPAALAIMKRLRPRRIAVGFGMTEGTITLLNIIDPESLDLGALKQVSVGTVQSGARVRICAPGSRVPLRRGEVGELHESGLPVFRGYLQQSAPTCYQNDGMFWIATGDQAYMDSAGQVYIISRYKDLIIRGGENISPAIIETSLGRVPGVVAQVVGVPDPEAGEVPIAVIHRTGSSIPVSELQRAVLAELGPTFVPQRILDLQEHLQQTSFPTTSTGKVQKATLRQWVMDYLRQTDLPDRDEVDQSLEKQLSLLWASICGQDACNLFPDTEMSKIADSMMVLQFCGLVRRKLQKIVTMEEVMDANTIRMQSEILKGRALATDGSGRGADQHEHSGPDIITMEALIPMEILQERSQQQLADLGLTWADVEDVIPMTDIMQVMVKGRRPNSWNHRHCVLVNPIGSSQLVVVLRMWLQRHALLRSTVVSYDRDTSFYLAMRPLDSWFAHQIFEGDRVSDIHAFSAYRVGNAAYDLVPSTGPLVKATVLDIEDVGSGSRGLGVILHIQHCIFDGLTIQRWYQDLGHLLQRAESALEFHAYRDFALLYSWYRHQRVAKESIDFHVHKLRGVSSSVAAHWPAQRAPFWLKGQDQGWTNDDGTPGLSAERRPLDGPESRGTIGLVRTAHIPSLSRLRSSVGISPPMVAKCACALVNLIATGADEAIFASIESGRSQLPVDDVELGNPIDTLQIDGPTTNEALNRIRLVPGETVLQFLSRMQQEQRELDRHAHAPIFAIRDTLARESGTGEADARDYMDLLRRQIFDWMPSASNDNASTATTPAPMKILEILPRTDLGMVWFPNLSEDDMLELEVTYDDAQFTAAEVRQWMTQFMNATAWLANAQNLQRPVREYDGQLDELQIAEVEPHHRYRR